MPRSKKIVETAIADEPTEMVVSDSQAEAVTRTDVEPEQAVERPTQTATEADMLELLGELKKKDYLKAIPINSLEASVSYGSLLRQMHRCFSERIAYYRSAEGGALSVEEARATAFQPCKDAEDAKRKFDSLMSLPLDIINFVDISELWAAAPRVAEAYWERVKSEGRDEFESGHLASKAMLPAKDMRSMWTTACYIGLRESLADEWQPRGGIELSLIDMMAQAFLQCQYWTEQTVLRSQTAPREEAYEYTRWKNYQRGVKTASWEDGYWDIPYVREQEAVEHAAQMADRWNRIYMRTLRNLRDLRRYMPQVTITNAQQVNIAADGGQQVNVKTEQ
ncbi:MAG: hypothetical protein M3458_01215 [Acidobacteriota bacterium]|nr:hypothetical protein [Acidobacteriota bacterium]